MKARRFEQSNVVLEALVRGALIRIVPMQDVSAVLIKFVNYTNVPFTLKLNSVIRNKAAQFE